MKNTAQRKQKLETKPSKQSKPNSLWKDVIIGYLSLHERSMIAQDLQPMVTTKELLDAPLKELGGDSKNKAHQMKVGTILVSLKWENLGKKSYQGKRQKVYGKRDTSVVVSHKVEKLEAIDIQSNATPATPSKPATLLATSKEKCDMAIIPTAKKFATPATPTTDESIVNFDNSSTAIANFDNEEEKYLQGCDSAGIPLEIGDYLSFSDDESAILLCEKLHKMAEEYPELETNYCAQLIHLEQVTINRKVFLLLVAQWINQKCFTFFVEDNSQHTGRYFLHFKQLRKMVCQDGKWVVAMS